MERSSKPLSRTSAAQLPVDTARLVAFGSHDVQAAEWLHALPKLNVGATSGHISCDGYSSLMPGTGDNFGFLLVVLGVEHAVDDAVLLE